MIRLLLELELLVDVGEEVREYTTSLLSTDTTDAAVIVSKTEEDVDVKAVTNEPDVILAVRDDETVDFNDAKSEATEVSLYVIVEI